MLWPLRLQNVQISSAAITGFGWLAMVLAGMEKQGLSREEAMQRFWLIDHKGLITLVRAGGV